MQRRAYLSAVAGVAGVTTAGCSALPLGTGAPPTREDLSALTHERVNEVRTDHDLAVLAYDDALEEVAASHSQDMADREYFDHESPDGETRADRYAKFDYDCHVRVDETHYATGGENIWNINYSGRSFSASQLAQRAVRDWMTSPPHRENMLHEFWRREAIGVAVREVDDEIRVYLTQNFC